MKKLRQLFGASPQSSSNVLWQPQPRCAFLQLPGELRNNIYSLVLRESDPFFDDHINLACLLQPALTATCRQIQYESLPIFFAENCFKLTIRITPKWHLEPLIDECTLRWIKAAGNDARGLREVDFFVDRPGRRRYRAVQLLPWENPHFNTSWSLSIRNDNSDWPHCMNYFIALHWTRLAKNPEKRLVLTFDDVIGIGKETAATWVPPVHRWAMRRLGPKKIKTIRKLVRKLWPKSWMTELVEPACECNTCSTERREAAKAERKRRKQLERKGEESVQGGVAGVKREQ